MPLEQVLHFLTYQGFKLEYDKDIYDIEMKEAKEQANKKGR